MSATKSFGIGPGDMLSAREAVGKGEAFTVRIPSLLARLIPGHVGLIDPGTAALIIVIGGLAIFAGLAAYAISKGYTVKRKSPDGEEWEFSPG